VPAFGHLSDREKMAVVDFALLWSFFESRCLDNNANMGRIRYYVRHLPETLGASQVVQDLADYFKARYIENGGYSFRYQRLHLERSQNPEEVSRMLLGKGDSRETLAGCLGIIFRFRNNLFHGEKWEYELQEQQDNFERSTALLRWLMEHNNAFEVDAPRRER